MDATNLPKRYRAIIADDDPMFRYTLRAVVQEACEVIAEAENGLAAIQAAGALWRTRKLNGRPRPPIRV